MGYSVQDNPTVAMIPGPKIIYNIYLFIIFKVKHDKKYSFCIICRNI